MKDGAIEFNYKKPFDELLILATQNHTLRSQHHKLRFHAVSLRLGLTEGQEWGGIQVRDLFFLRPLKSLTKVVFVTQYS